MPWSEGCAKRVRLGTADNKPSAQDPSREVQPGAHREVTAPLPPAQKRTPCTFGNKPPGVSKWQIVNPVSREFVALIEAGKPAIHRDIKRVLRHHPSPAADRRSIIDGF